MKFINDEIPISSPNAHTINDDFFFVASIGDKIIFLSLNRATTDDEILFSSLNGIQIGDENPIYRFVSSPMR